MRTPRLVLALPIIVFSASAQAPHPSFEAASVKSNPSGGPLVRLATPPGRFSAVNVTLRMLVREAFRRQDFRVVGGPSWMETARFDVEATAGSPVAFDENRAMLRTLLEDRFHLKTHLETRELPIYVLSVARRDAKLGDQIKPSGAECLPVTLPKGAPPPPPPPPGPRPAGAPQCPSLLAPGHISGRRITITRLVTTLSLFLSREVVDRTNLSGDFDLDLQWLPDQPPPTDVRNAPSDGTAPPLFTAMQEQLGLKLEPSRAAVEVLVIDSVEKPTED